MISDKRMDELIQRAKDAATRGIGGGDGSVYRELFSDEVYKVTLAALVDLESKQVCREQYSNLPSRNPEAK